MALAEMLQGNSSNDAPLLRLIIKGQKHRRARQEFQQNSPKIEINPIYNSKDYQ